MSVHLSFMYSPPPPLSFSIFSASDSIRRSVLESDFAGKLQSRNDAREMDSVSFAETIGKDEKLCFDCKTSKTPLWRSGPAGPKSLCNACGIRFRKKKSVAGSDQRKEKHHASPSPTSSATDENTMSARKREIRMDDGDFRKKLRIKVVAMGKETEVLQRRRSPMKKVRRIDYTVKKFGEVEEAAYLLMCLSCS